MEKGTRVMLTHDVDRYPHFVAPKGATGTVVEGDDEVDRFTRVRMDEFIAGAEEWDNEIHWFDGMNPSDDLREIQ